MRSSGVRVVLSLGRPDPDRLSTAMLWSLIAHFGLVAGAIVWQMIPSPPSRTGEPHFVTLAAPGRPAGGGGGGRAEPEPPKPRDTSPPAPKAPAEPPPPPVPASNKATVPTDKPAKPSPPTHAHETAPAPTPAHEAHGEPSPPSPDGPHGDTAGGGGKAGAAPGPAGDGPPDAGGVGGTSFGEGDFRFGWYQSAIESKLQSSWRKPLATEGETQTATVSFVILRNGAVKDVQVVTSSGNPTMDLSVMRAVYDANPLPALPRGWSGDSVHVSMEFSLEPGAP